MRKRLYIHYNCNNINECRKLFVNYMEVSTDTIYIVSMINKKLANCFIVSGKYNMMLVKNWAHHTTFHVSADSAMFSYFDKYETPVWFAAHRLIIDHLSIFMFMPLDLGISLEKVAS